MRRIAILLVSLCLFSVCKAYGQDPLSERGVKPFSTYDLSVLGDVNVSNGNLDLRIPLFSFPQRGGKLDLTVYLYATSKGFYQLCGDQFCQWATDGIGCFADSNSPCELGAAIIRSDDYGLFNYCATDDCDVGIEKLQNSDGGGVQLIDTAPHPGSVWAPAYTVADMSGITAITTGAQAGVYLPNGVVVASPTERDANGNSITFNATAGTATDTEGRVIPLLQGRTATSASDTSDCPGGSTQGDVFNIPSVGGSTQAFKVCRGPVDIATHFNTGIPEFSRPGSLLILGVVLPSHKAWALTYDSYGDVTSVTTPDGGKAAYQWSIQNTDGLPSNFVASRTLDAQDGSPVRKWAYSYSFGPTTLVSQTVITDPAENDTNYSLNTTSATGGVLVDRIDYYSGTGSSRGLLQSEIRSYTSETQCTSCLPLNVRMMQQTIKYPDGVHKDTILEYAQGASFIDQNNRSWPVYTPSVAHRADYDYSSSQLGTMLRSVDTHYLSQDNPAYLSVGLLNLASTATISNGSGTTLSQSTYAYDESNGSPQGVRGNPTTFTTSGTTTKTVIYDGNGMPTQSKDGNGNQTTYSYQCSDAVPQTIVNALAQTTTYGYDCNSSLLLSVRDPNDVAAGRAGTVYSYTVMQDIQSISYPDGGQASFDYHGYATPLTITKTETATPDPSIGTAQHFDGFHRLIESDLASDPAGAVITKQAYDALGRVGSISNPYRATTDSSYGVISFTYDALGRKTLQTQQDESVQKWSYSDNIIKFTDEASHSWQRISDALGRLINVVEPSGAQTGYVYDALGNLRTVNQNGVSGETPRTRSFSYDSLSRLLTLTNPETGAISYSYDANSNLLSKTDARGITTSYSYDALNRMTQRSYSDGVTLPVLYGYDAPSVLIGTTHITPANGVGRLSWSCVLLPKSCQSQTAYSYDSMGRLIEKLYTTPNNPTTGAVYAMSAKYDLAGDRTSLTDSTGRTFNYSYDAAGRLQTASNTINLNAIPATTPMVSSMTYFPSGQPQTMTTDTGSATVTGTWGVDKRLRVTSYQNLSTANAANMNYGYSLTYTPNSNVLTDAETVYDPASGSISWNWNFGYDSLNRLTSAQSAGAIQRGCAWTYDSFGNRLDQEPSGTGLTCTSVSTPVNANNQLSGTNYSYDAAGHILKDGANTLTYDAEGRISAYNGASGGTTYTYGADDQRVSKTAAGVETDFIRDLDGTLLNTYVSGSYIDQPQEMWIAGRHYGTVYSFVSNGVQEQSEGLSLTNWLGSEAMRSFSVSNGANTGVPTYAFVSQPFGDGQTTLIGGDHNDIHFTGKERDTESGLDYFGARYYGSSMGRWMSPDILNVTEDRLMFPSSTLNKYAYGANNPLKYVDPDGKDITVLYDPTGVTHLALAAYDPQTGKGAFESFAPQDHSLGSQTKELLGADASGSVSDYKVSDYGNADFLRSNYASLTIQTSPEVTQEAINFINSHPDGNWNMYTNNCSTACVRVLKDIGLIGGGHFTPHAVWSTLVSKYGNQHGFRNFMAQHSPTRGNEYGRPSPGVNPFDLLQLMMQHCTAETVTVTINGTSTSSSHQNCSK